MSATIGKPAWHAYHNHLFVFLKQNVNQRVATIRLTKPHDEIGLRLRLFKLILGDLPAEVIDANRVLDEARNAPGYAFKPDDRWGAINAIDAAIVAYGATLHRYASEIEMMHDAECPDCPWDGCTIFPNGETTCTINS